MRRNTIETVSRRYRYTETETHTQTQRRPDREKEKNLKPKSTENAKSAQAATGLGMKGSRLLTRQVRWQLKNPEKRRAHEMVRQALLKGTLVKQPCEDCGTDKHVDAHHDDYSKPLEVSWLCRRDHMRRHRRKIVKGPGEASS